MILPSAVPPAGLDYKTPGLIHGGLAVRPSGSPRQGEVAAQRAPSRAGPGGDMVGCGRYSPGHAADAGGAAGDPGRGVGADHLRQPGERLHRGPGGHRPVQRPADRGRSAAWGTAWGELAPAGPVGQPSPVRPPVSGRGLRHGAAGDDPGDPPLPRLGADQGDRPQDGRADRGPLRRGHLGGDRAGARAAGRGAGAWS
jgi:hypothetical protein